MVQWRDTQWRSGGKRASGGGSPGPPCRLGLGLGKPALKFFQAISEICMQLEVLRVLIGFPVTHCPGGATEAPAPERASCHRLSYTKLLRAHPALIS